MRNKSYRFSFLILLFWLAATVGPAQPIGPKVQRILFLGNSITHAGYYVNQVAAYITAQNPNQQLEFINVGLPSETVSGLSEAGHAGGSFPRPDLHERLVRVLEQTKPDLVFACYGMNDGIYLPFDESRFLKFKAGMNWLHAQVTKTGARIIHITPPDYDELKGKKAGYRAVLDKYANWLLSQQKPAQWEVIDIHYPMQQYLQAHRQVEAAFRMNNFALAPDGVHPGEVGHWLMAREILTYLGYKEVSRMPGIVESLKQVPDAAQFYKLVTERQNMLRDAWLTATKHQRPGLPVGLPLPEAQRQAAELKQQMQALLGKDANR